MDLKEFQELRNRYENAQRKDGLEIVITEFGKLFAANPTLLSVTWRQYTPYFNDGDPCIFRVSIDNMHADTTTKEDVCADDVDAGECPEIDAAYNTLSECLTVLGRDTFKAAFGNDSEITIGRDPETNDTSYSISDYTGHD